jgi:peroxiredoxin Q/BCP
LSDQVIICRHTVARARLAASVAFAISLTAAAGLAAESPAEGGLLRVGAQAPPFSVTAHDGRKVDLRALKGKYVVLYFYPMDDTPGCSMEAAGFRDSWSQLRTRGAIVVGVSTQDNVSHRAFARKYDIPFPLLPDSNGDLAAKYRVPVVNGVARRITYLIGKDGHIKHVWPQVVPSAHAGEILAQLH